MRDVEELFEKAVEENRQKWSKLQDKEVNYSFPISEVTLKQLFNQWAEKRPNKTYIYHKGKEHSYQECNLKARKIANGFINLGARKGDRVVTFLNNGVEFVCIAQACFKTGMILVNSNPMDSPAGMAYRIQDSGAKFVVSEEAAWGSLSKAFERNGKPAEYLVVNGNKSAYACTCENMPKIVSLEELMQHDQDEPTTDIQLDDIMVLQYTGGTTGIQKACCQTNRAYVARTEVFKEFMIPFGINEENFSVIIGLPMSHAYGFAQGVIGNLSLGGSMVLTDSDRPDTELIFETIQKHKPILWPSVPRWLKEWAGNSELQQYDVTSLKAITCGSAPLPLSTIEKVESVSGAVITEGYGLTETINTVTGNAVSSRRPGKVGIPFPNMDYLIVDSDTGDKVMPVGQEGEIIVRGATVFKEYWNKPTETANSFKHGWFYTGDVGMLDEDGYLQIMDRKKDMIIVSGFNVYPKEIEDIMIDYPGILDVCCIGTADERRGEVPVVYVVKKPGADVSESDLFDFCYENFARYKVPKEIYFVDSIPKTANNKPDRKALKQMHEQSLMLMKA